MSSRIIRGDNRAQKLKVVAPSGAVVEGISQEHIEKEAFEQGYAEGERIGKQMGEAMIETICRRYEKSLADLAVSHREMTAAMEKETVRLAVEIARKIVKRELTVDPDLLVALSAAALKRVSGHQSITLSVSAHDIERVRAAVAAVNSAVTVKEDCTIERGDFVIETAQTHLDGRLGSQIDAMSRALFDE